MRNNSLAKQLWGKHAKRRLLFMAAIILLFTFLGGREIWTQEHRWADIVSGMFYRHDFLHPFLGVNNYYDKPLLSYWLIALTAKLLGSLSSFALRLPSALAALLALFSMYQLGTSLKNKSVGLLASWLLLTTFYFIFWGRVSSADMLNLAGSLFAISWYITHRERTTFFSYAIFFLIIAITSLCKGLIGAIVPLIAIFIDICLQKTWRLHLRPKLFLSMIPALFIYLLPFIASSYFANEGYHENGLYLVYRENILRYFQPFDHRGPIYTYFIYLPIYLLPAACFLLLPALFTLPARLRTMSRDSLFITVTLCALFLFFTFSGSRRSYYVLPIVPFAILFIADFILDKKNNFAWQIWTARLILISFVLLFVVVDVAPKIYYEQLGLNRFANELIQRVEVIKPWQEWHIVLLDAEAKINFYLSLPPHVKNFDVEGSRETQSQQDLETQWPIIRNQPAGTIFITRKRYQEKLQTYFSGYEIFEIKPSTRLFSYINKHDLNTPIAFIPTR